MSSYHDAHKFADGNPTKKMTLKGGVYSRLDMIRALVTHFRMSGMLVRSNVDLGVFQSDVLTLDKSQGAFVAVQCMHGGQPNTLAAHFSKADSYLTAAKCGTLKFHALTDKKSKATTRRLLSVSVALMDRTCKRRDLLRSLKAQFPAVGIVRVKMNGQCRDYIRDGDGNKDLALTAGAPVELPAQGKIQLAKK